MAFLASPGGEDAEDPEAIKGFALWGLIQFNPWRGFYAARFSAYLEEDELTADPSHMTHPITFPEQHPCCAEIKADGWANIHMARGGVGDGGEQGSDGDSNLRSLLLGDESGCKTQVEYSEKL